MSAAMNLLFISLSNTKIFRVEGAWNSTQSTNKRIHNGIEAGEMKWGLLLLLLPGFR